VLETILAEKRAELARRKRERSLESLLGCATPTSRSLTTALSRVRPGFLLEIKFASPSAGTIRADPDLEPVLASYGRHADAVSVLTDHRFFGGSLERLAQVRARLNQPLLCKDFVLDPYQVAEARAFGADAILLILAAIDDATWQACAELAARLGMEVLTEVHDAEEAARAVRLGARIIGVNHRDLRTLRIDPALTARIAPALPGDRLVIAESGVETREQVRSLRPWADGFLVGTALMREPDLDAAVRHLVYGRTKVCGLTRSHQAAAARHAGATHGGLVFAPGSPRRVALPRAEEIRSAVPLEWVGVFADSEPSDVAAIAEHLELAAVQLHGTESREMVAQIRSLLPASCEVWKAVPGDCRVPLRTGIGADRLLLDGTAPGWDGRAARLGGWGIPFDWSALAGYPERAEVVLAGGLRAGNVAAAAALGTWALDVSSGVESAPGEKDPELLAAFFAERRRLPGRGGG
jgi:indole-3-glycerol phosphate synthase/phosphoribosylanthranilate isomerase